jgi:choline dehydrogenase-like flavoprotein
MHHPTGTAKMRQDSLSVADAQLRVYGTKNLRIADDSIMPRVTTGNAQAPCVIIGERMAEILKARPDMRAAPLSPSPGGAARERNKHNNRGETPWAR